MTIRMVKYPPLWMPASLAICKLSSRFASDSGLTNSDCNSSINNSPEQETGGGMDFSPAAPLASRQQQQRAERPVLTKPRARTLDRAATYDSAFFSKLAAQKRPSADAPKVPSSKPDFTKNRTFGDQLDTNSAPKILPREIGARPLVKKTQSDAILQFQPTQQGKTVPDARPSLQRMRGHSTSSSMGNLLFKVDQSSQALDSEAPYVMLAGSRSVILLNLFAYPQITTLDSDAC